MRPVFYKAALMAASAIPVSLIAHNGCNRINQTEEVKKVKELTNIKHTTEVFQFKRDKDTGKIFIELEKDEEKVNDARCHLKLLWQEVDILQAWAKEFNKKSENLEQKEIKISDLASPQIPKITKARADETDLFEEFNIFNPEGWDTTYPFQNIVRKDYHDLESNRDIITRQGTVNSFSHVYTAYFSYNNNLPLSVSVPGNYFVPESVSRKYYLDKIGADFKQKEFGIKEGIYFVAKGKVRKVEVVVPLSSLPLTIDTGKKMYIIGLNTIGTTQKGSFKKE